MMGKSRENKKTVLEGGKVMEPIDIAHPRPIDEEEPPAKQLKTGEVKSSSNALAADLSGEVANVPRTKTSLCSYFRKGSCRHGDACRYAHGEDELKPRPDGTWDPTSDRAKSLLRDAPPAPKAVKLIAPTSMEEESAEDDAAGASFNKCIIHVPLRWTQDEFRKFLTDSKVAFLTAKKRRGVNTAFVGFQFQEQVDEAISILEGKKLGNKTIQVADVRPRAWERNTESKNEPSNDGDMADGDGVEGQVATTRVKNVCDAVTPLGHLTYEEQLNMKREDITQVLKRLARNTRKGIPAGVLMPDWLVAARDNGGLPCALEGVLASPVVDGYRNKCEFSIGCAVDGTRAVGFQLGSFREGILAVAEPTDCRNVSNIARSYAAAFQKFVQGSELSVWNKTNNKGFWRMLTVREGRAAAGDTPGDVAPITEVMLVVQVCPLHVEEKTRNREYKQMADQLSLAASSAVPPLPLTALLVQDHTGVSNAAPANAPLHSLTIPRVHSEGQKPVDYIHDHLSNLKFRISPTAFFQVNTLAAERLYSLAGDWAELTPDTLLFDVCCGTGTIGLTLAHRVGMVVGIEMNESAVADANKNAEINNITNCRFVASKAEDCMEDLLKEYITSREEEEEADAGEEETEVNDISDKKRFKNIVAIVDPPRVGLHPVVLKTLRLHTQLRRLVYISCNPQSLLANAVELCTPLSRENSSDKGRGWQGSGNWKGLSNVGQARNRVKKMPPSTPYNPVKAMAVDLFPHTSHCEMVMLFER